MTFYANALQSIKVVDRNGVEKATMSGKIKLLAGSGFELVHSRDDNSITLNAGDAYATADERFRRKLEVIINGGTFIDDDGTPMTFSGMPYYIGAINGVRANFVNNFDFYGTACGQVGVWGGGVGSGEPEYPSGGWGGGGSESVGEGALLDETGVLRILDICQACIDCQDYEDIKVLMSRIEEFQVWDVTRNLYDDQTDIPSGELALFRQYQSTIHYWNYLVHNQTIPLKVIKGSDTYFAINTGYYLKACVDLTEIVQKLTLNISWCGASGIVDVRLTNSIGVPVTMEVFGNLVVITYPPMSYRDYAFFQLTVRTSEPVCGFSVTSEWCNTHLTLGPLGSDEPGDQCITRSASV